ncbi:hypothetical protein HZU73_04583 [Apis mellifera caucasica]|nr:hypothetical protein HZU73_04583 [Apis mellifera caucasica]
MARHGVEHRVEPRFDHDLRQTGETKTHARDPDPKIPFTRESVNGGGGGGGGSGGSGGGADARGAELAGLRTTSDRHPISSLFYLHYL